MNAEGSGIDSLRMLGPASTALVHWLRAGRTHGWSEVGTLMRYRWNRPFFDWNLAMQRKLLPPVPLRQDPAWILGLWRSGTTALHEALMARADLCTPRTWQCMAPATFGITGRPRQSVQRPRPMDDLSIGTESPQEDEFAWLLLGGDSAYRSFIDPSRLTELVHTLEPATWEADPWPAEQAWRDFLGQVSAQDGGRRRLLLKSPNHTFRARGILRRFPASSLVWITRDPAEIVESNQKMWRSMMALYALRPLPAKALDDFLALALANAAAMLDELCARCSKKQLVVVQQVDLKSNPDRLVDGLLARWATTISESQDGTLPVAGGAALTTKAFALRPEVALARAQQRALASHGL